MNIGILGGAFNPPTVGHVRLAECALLGADLDAVWLMPSANHPYGKEMADPEERLLMCMLIIRELSERLSGKVIQASDFEIERASILSGYTIDTMRRLNVEYRYGDEFFVVIGMDNARTIRKWNRGDDLIQEFRFVVCPRKGEESLPEDVTTWYHEKRFKHIFVDPSDVDIVVPEVSSTMVRNAVKDGDDVSNWVGNKVARLIENRRLYL